MRLEAVNYNRIKLLNDGRFSRSNGHRRGAWDAEEGGRRVVGGAILMLPGTGAIATLALACGSAAGVTASACPAQFAQHVRTIAR